MNQPLLILTLSTLAAAGCTTTRVISDNSVTAQFIRYDGLNGARVTVGDGSSSRRTALQRPVASADRPNLPPPTNPLAHSTWSTNFKVDQPPSAGSVVAPPKPAPSTPQPSLPTLGGSPLPNTAVAPQ